LATTRTIFFSSAPFTTICEGVPLDLLAGTTLEMVAPRLIATRAIRTFFMISSVIFAV